jgi:hypothetical protein
MFKAVLFAILFSLNTGEIHDAAVRGFETKAKCEEFVANKKPPELPQGVAIYTECKEMPATGPSTTHTLYQQLPNQMPMKQLPLESNDNTQAFGLTL